jgi:hypothetical protein
VVDARLKIVLAIGLALLFAAVALVLTRSPLTVVYANVADSTLLETTKQPVSACQHSESVPRDISAIRLRAYSFDGPRVSVRLLSHGRVIGRGERGSGWTGGVVTVPVTPLPVARTGVTLCFAFHWSGYESGQLVGEPTTGPLAAYGRGGRLPGRVTVEYMRPGPASWFSLLPTVARRIGLARGWSGVWGAVLALLAMLAAATLCSRAILRGLG